MTNRFILAYKEPLDLPSLLKRIAILRSVTNTAKLNSKLNIHDKLFESKYNEFKRVFTNAKKKHKRRNWSPNDEFILVMIGSEETFFATKSYINFYSSRLPFSNIPNISFMKINQYNFVFGSKEEKFKIASLRDLRTRKEIIFNFYLKEHCLYVRRLDEYIVFLEAQVQLAILND